MSNQILDGCVYVLEVQKQSGNLITIIIFTESLVDEFNLGSGGFNLITQFRVRNCVN